jgi:hypothetical protein
MFTFLIVLAVVLALVGAFTTAKFVLLIAVVVLLAAFVSRSRVP